MSSSKIYEEITKEQLCTIAIDLYGTDTTLTRCHILKGGLFNTTYFVKTNHDKNGIVLRVGPVNPHLLFEFEKDMMSAEPLFHRLLQENNIPTSTILRHASKGEVIGREYIISEYIDSLPMNDPSLEGADLRDAYQEVGCYTKRMHRITNNRFGWKRNTGWGEYDRWSDFILSFAKEAADKAEAYGLFCKSDIEIFRAIFLENTNVLDEITTPYMTHTDLWQGNVLVKQNEGRYEVAAIIDLDRTIFGDQYWDVANPWMHNDAFFRGYGEQIPDTNHHITRQNLYKLLGGFFSAYVVLIEYDNNEWFLQEKNNAVLILNNIYGVQP